MITANDADRSAADSIFLLNIKEYALSDANGLATQEISKKLRSEKFHRDWSGALGLIAARATEPKLKKAINERRIEAAEIKRSFRIIPNDKPSMSISLIEKYGLSDFSGMSPVEIQIYLLAEILTELKKKYGGAA